MNKNAFAKLMTDVEGLKKQVNIAQMKEVIRRMDELLNGELSKLIRAM